MLRNDRPGKFLLQHAYSIVLISCRLMTTFKTKNNFFLNTNYSKSILKANPILANPPSFKANVHHFATKTVLTAWFLILQQLPPPPPMLMYLP